jgi:hypothetical protein
MQKRAGRIVRRLALSGVSGALVSALLVFAMPPAGQTAGAASAAPIVTSVSPSTGYGDDPPAPEPPTSVTISGTNFDGATNVSFGQYPAAHFTVVSSSEIVAIPGEVTLSTVLVTVTTPAGTSPIAVAEEFTFIAPPVPPGPPIVTSVTPSTVPGGGEVSEVEVHGSNFLYATTVQIGSTSMEVNPITPTDFTVDVPPEPIGTVLDLTVTGPRGTSATSPADRITYVVPPPTGGYWEVASDGGIFSFGNAPFYGSMGGIRLNAPVVGMAVRVLKLDSFSPVAAGYWEVASDGGIFSFGAPFYGSMGGTHLNAPVVAMAADTVTDGYWEVASDGGVFSFNAPFYGSAAGKSPDSRIVGMAATPDDGGYWLAAANGSVYAFGDASSFESTANPLASPVVGIAADPIADGYWLVMANGAVLSFGAAPDEGSAAGLPLDKPMVGLATRYNANGSSFGYWEAASDGGIFTFGNTDFYGSTGGMTLNAPIVGIGATPQPLIGPFAP